MKIKFTKNFSIALVVDIFLMLFSIYMAHLFRFDFSIPDHMFNSFLKVLPLLIGIKLGCFLVFNLYKGMWRYSGLNDLMNVVKVSTISTVLTIVTILYLNRFQMISRSVLIIDWCLTIILMMSVRIFTRLCFENFTENFSIRDIYGVLIRVLRVESQGGKGKRMIIIGAGDCGQMICREFKENASVRSHVVGFLDDDRQKAGRNIHGVPVLGIINDVDAIAESKNVEEAIIAISKISAQRMQEIVSLCSNAGIRSKTVPNMGELIDGKVKISSIRNVEYRDLLGRAPVRLNQKEIGEYLGARTVLVTGAAGSIGKGLCHQICRYSPKTLILFEIAESPLHDLDLELKNSFKHVEIVPLLGDIRNKEELRKSFREFAPEIIFHAAAYKHVPMMEMYPWKAVENNIMGTENLIEVARDSGCDRFVFVSTDKAVNPTNVMGTSKRIAELLVQECANSSSASKTRFMIVRFGNVIGSVGSVIPLFKRQIENGGPVTVTHPDIIRYFMLIPEACQLILQAGAMGAGKEIFILDMGKPIKIDRMARDLIRFSGFQPNIDIKIEYTGLRPGEKLYEELITDQESVISTDHEKIMMLSSVACVDNFEKKIERLKKEVSNRDRKKLKKMLQDIVPEYDYEQ